MIQGVVSSGGQSPWLVRSPVTKVVIHILARNRGRTWKRNRKKKKKLKKKRRRGRRKLVKDHVFQNLVSCNQDTTIQRHLGACQSNLDVRAADSRGIGSCDCVERRETRGRARNVPCSHRFHMPSIHAHHPPPCTSLHVWYVPRDWPEVTGFLRLTFHRRQSESQVAVVAAAEGMLAGSFPPSSSFVVSTSYSEFIMHHKLIFPKKPSGNGGCKGREDHSGHDFQ